MHRYSEIESKDVLEFLVDNNSVAVGDQVMQIFFSRTTGPEKLTFTRKLSYIVQNQVVRIILAPGGRLEPQ
jgi:hypothetical protein